MNKTIILVSIVVIFASSVSASQNVAYIVVADGNALINTAQEVEYYLKKQIEKRMYAPAEISTRELAVFEDDINTQMKEAKNLISEGKRLYEELKLEQCFFIFQKIINNMERGPAAFEKLWEYQEALMYLGAIYHLNGDAQSARNTFKKLIIYNNKYNPDPNYFPPDIIDAFQSSRGDIKSSSVGTLLVTPKPEDIQVFLNGTFVGGGARKIDNLIAGEYLIGLKKRGYLPYTRKVIIQSGLMEVITIDLLGFSEIISRYAEISKMKKNENSPYIPRKLREYLRAAGSDTVVVLFLSGSESSFMIDGYTYYKDRLVAYDSVAISPVKGMPKEKTIRLKVEDILKRILPDDISKLKPVEKIVYQKFYTTWWFYSIMSATLIGAGVLGYFLFLGDSREDNSGALIIYF